MQKHGLIGVWLAEAMGWDEIATSCHRGKYNSL